MSQKIAQRLLRVASTPEGLRLLSGFLYSKSAAKSDRSKRFTWGKGDIDLKIKGVSKSPKKAMEFPTQEAMKKYLDEHPGADKSIHHVVETKPKPKSPEAPKKKEPLVPTIKKFGETLDFLYSDNVGWRSTLSNKERMALYSYTYQGDEDMNSLLRNNLGADDEELVTKVHDAMNALEKFNLRESIYVYRGMYFEAIPENVLQDVIAGEVKPEDVQWTDKGFVSTTIQDNHSFSDRQVQCKIALPKGTKGAYIEHLSKFPQEFEFLVAPGNTFQLTGVKLVGSQYFLDVELLPDRRQTAKPTFDPVKVPAKHTKPKVDPDISKAKENMKKILGQALPEKWFKTLSMQEQESIVGAKKSNSTLGNFLRSKDPSEEDKKHFSKHYQHLMSAMDKSSLPESVEVYQDLNSFMSPDMLKDLKEGISRPQDFVVEDVKYQKTNLFPNSNDTIKCKITLPKGSPGMYVGEFSGLPGSVDFQDRSLFLLKPGYTFELKSLSLNKDMGKWEAEATISYPEKDKSKSDKTASRRRIRVAMIQSLIHQILSRR